MIPEINVGMGHFTVKGPGFNLKCLGIGSCIAVAIYDKKNKIYGLAHIMLPFSDEQIKKGNPNKFADQCIPNMVKEMMIEGAEIKELRAKIAGGAHMFPSLKKNLLINERNQVAVKEVLHKMNIPIIGQDLGGNSGRTTIFNTTKEEYKIIIRSQGTEKII